jgi:hypothetical protein
MASAIIMPTGIDPSQLPIAIRWDTGRDQHGIATGTFWCGREMPAVVQVELLAVTLVSCVES